MLVVLGWMLDVDIGFFKGLILLLLVMKVVCSLDGCCL